MQVFGASVFTMVGAHLLYEWKTGLNNDRNHNRNRLIDPGTPIKQRTSPASAASALLRSPNGKSGVRSPTSVSPTMVRIQPRTPRTPHQSQPLRTPASSSLLLGSPVRTVVSVPTKRSPDKPTLTQSPIRLPASSRPPPPPSTP